MPDGLITLPAILVTLARDPRPAILQLAEAQEQAARNRSAPVRFTPDGQTVANANLVDLENGP
ncbi:MULTISPECIES: hypothetical protein [Rhodanobacter]|nr:MULTISPECIES: hypothetical protein [Rhodanobacter]UJJ56276.1 hypothetical protein LRK53_07870 [Rhodanobacter thiooxydans]